MYELAHYGFGFKVDTYISFFLYLFLTSNNERMLKVTLWGQLGDELLKKKPDNCGNMHAFKNFEH